MAAGEGSFFTSFPLLSFTTQGDVSLLDGVFLFGEKARTAASTSTDSSFRAMRIYSISKYDARGLAPLPLVDSTSRRKGDLVRVSSLALLSVRAGGSTQTTATLPLQNEFRWQESSISNAVLLGGKVFVANMQPYSNQPSQSVLLAVDRSSVREILLHGVTASFSPPRLLSTKKSLFLAHVAYSPDLGRPAVRVMRLDYKRSSTRPSQHDIDGKATQRSLPNQIDAQVIDNGRLNVTWLSRTPQEAYVERVQLSETFQVIRRDRVVIPRAQQLWTAHFVRIGRVDGAVVVSGAENRAEVAFVPFDTALARLPLTSGEFIEPPSVQTRARGVIEILTAPLPPNNSLPSIKRIEVNLRCP
jgi:hypothetical protein